MRKDRNLLMVLYLDGDQILQVRRDLFGEPNDDTAEFNCLVFMREIAEKFMRGKINRLDLETQRDNKLLAMGIKQAKKGRKGDDEPSASGPPRPARKRPAASLAAAKPEAAAACETADDPAPTTPKPKTQSPWISTKEHLRSSKTLITTITSTSRATSTPTAT